jgi:hypothetical protein
MSREKAPKPEGKQPQGDKGKRRLDDAGKRTRGRRSVVENAEKK